MRKQYETLELNFIFYKEDIVRTSDIEVDGQTFYGDDGWVEN